MCFASLKSNCQKSNSTNVKLIQDLRQNGDLANGKTGDISILT